MENNKENDLKEFLNESRELAKDHTIALPLQREELSEIQMKTYRKHIMDESKKKYSDTLSQETANEMLEITLQNRRTRKEEIFQNGSIKKEEVK